jgi:hypothetical protein
MGLIFLIGNIMLPGPYVILNNGRVFVHPKFGSTPGDSEQFYNAIEFP